MAIATPTSIQLYDTFTLKLSQPNISTNKFQLFPQATFTKGKKSFFVEGFFDGDENGNASGTIWKIRFMPNEIGKWNYSWHFNGEKGAGTVNVTTQTNPLIPGNVTIAGRFLKTANGQGFVFFGSNWPDTRRLRVNDKDSDKTFISHDDWKNYIKRLRETKHNGTNIMALDRTLNNDRSSFDLEWVNKVDFAITEAGHNGIYVFLGLFNTWTRNATDSMSSEMQSSKQILDPWNNNLMKEKEFYLRYLTARFSGYYNIMWELGNEMGHSPNNGSDFANLANKYYISWLRQYAPYAIPITLSEGIYKSTNIDIGGLHQGESIKLNETIPVIHTELVKIEGASTALWGGDACKNPDNRKYYRKTIWNGFFQGGSGAIECSLPFSGKNAFPTMTAFLNDPDVTNVMDDHGKLATFISSLKNDLTELHPVHPSKLGTSASYFSVRAKESSEYIAYFYGKRNKRTTITLSLSQDHLAQWISPSSGQYSAPQLVTAKESISSPWANEYDVVLHLYSSDHSNKDE
ncbi:MAG: DUF5060 domain-containing protein [Gammaproteobacteria bacterium]|nr:DUF5060 domain-containing protein [Gammaproteobacteria bacterium]